MSGRGRCLGGGLCFILCCLMSASCLSAKKRDAPGVDLLTFQVKKISQQRTEDGYNIQIQLTGDHMPQVYIQNSTLMSQPHYYGMPSSDGLVELHTATGQARVLFTHPRGFQAVDVMLDENSTSEVVVPDIDVFSKGGRNITFERGNNATVNLTVRQSDVSRRFQFEFFMTTKSQIENNSIDIYFDPRSFPFEVLDRAYNENEKYAHFRLLTSSGDVEGILQLHVYLGFHCRRSGGPCIEGGYLIQEGLPVYQEDHAGPFPEHYIGRVNFEHLRKRSRGTPDVEYCPKNRGSCHLMCLFVGDRPSAVQFDRVAGDMTPSSQISLSNDGYLAGGFMEFENLTANTEVVYKCKSTSGQLELSHTMTLIVTDDAKIDNDRSGIISRLDNGTVDVACFAQGTPAPTITFITENYNPLSQVINSTSYHIVQTPLTNTTSKAVLRIYDPAVANQLEYVLCQATNTFRGREMKNYMYIRVYQNEPIVFPFRRALYP